MTKEQEETISRLRKITNRQILYGNKFGITIEGFKELQEVLETALNMLKEKDSEIEKYKNLLASNLARNLNDSIKAKEKANTDLKFLDLGWKTELEKKDKMIDLMAEELQKHIFVLYDGDTITSKKGIIQHYERKVEDERNKI